MLIAFAGSLRAQNCNTCSDGRFLPNSALPSTFVPRTYPTHVGTLGPIQEQQPGANLYWHDEARGWQQDCRQLNPSILGCNPNWFVRSEAIFLARDAHDNFNFASNGAGGTHVLNTRSFNDEFEGGLRLTVGYELSDWYRIEGSYFGLQTWGDEASVRNNDNNSQGSTGNLFSPFSNFAGAGTAGLDFNNLATIRFETQLHNSEINIRRRMYGQPGNFEASFLVGARWTQINEEFGYFSNSLEPTGGTQNDVDIQTQNDLIGIQIGLLTQILIQPRAWIDFEMKGGIFNNDAGQATNYSVTNIGGTNSFQQAASINRTSWMGDLSLQFNYQFLETMTFTVGYNAIWVTGLALGADNFQSDVNFLTLGPPQLNHSGQLLFHGPSIGFVWAH